MLVLIHNLITRFRAIFIISLTIILTNSHHDHQVQSHLHPAGPLRFPGHPQLSALLCHEVRSVAFCLFSPYSSLQHHHSLWSPGRLRSDVNVWWRAKLTKLQSPSLGEGALSPKSWHCGHQHHHRPLSSIINTAILIVVNLIILRENKRQRDANNTTLMLIVVISVFLAVELPLMVMSALHTINSRCDDSILS